MSCYLHLFAFPAKCADCAACAALDSSPFCVNLQGATNEQSSGQAPSQTLDIDFGDFEQDVIDRTLLNPQPELEVAEAPAAPTQPCQSDVFNHDHNPTINAANCPTAPTASLNVFYLSSSPSKPKVIASNMILLALPDTSGLALVKLGSIGFCYTCKSFFFRPKDQL